MFVKSAAILALAGAFTAVSASPTPDTIQLPDGDCAPHGIHLLVGEWTKVESRFKNENDYWWGPGQDESMSFPRFVFDFDAAKTPPYTREVFFLTTYKPNGQLWGDAQMDLSKLLIDQVMSVSGSHHSSHQSIPRAD